MRRREGRPKQLDDVPEGPVGACAARLKTKTDSATRSYRQKLTFDAAIGDYQVKDKYKVDCGEDVTGKVWFKNAYSSTFTTTLSVASAVKAADGSVYATEMSASG